MSVQTHVERLRATLLKRSRESYGLQEGVEWTPQQSSWEIANLLPSFYGLFKAVADTANPYRSWDEETLMMEVRNLGFTSAPAFLEALDQIRESLRPELSEEDWGIFFQPTLGITS